MTRDDRPAGHSDNLGAMLRREYAADTLSAEQRRNHLARLREVQPGASRRGMRHLRLAEFAAIAAVLVVVVGGIVAWERRDPDDTVSEHGPGVASPTTEQSEAIEIALDALWPLTPERERHFVMDVEVLDADQPYPSWDVAYLRWNADVWQRWFEDDVSQQGLYIGDEVGAPLTHIIRDGRQQLLDWYPRNDFDTPLEMSIYQRLWVRTAEALADPERHAFTFRQERDIAIITVEWEDDQTRESGYRVRSELRVNLATRRLEQLTRIVVQPSGETYPSRRYTFRQIEEAPAGTAPEEAFALAERPPDILATPTSIPTPSPTPTPTTPPSATPTVEVGERIPLPLLVDGGNGEQVTLLRLDGEPLISREEAIQVIADQGVSFMRDAEQDPTLRVDAWYGLGMLGHPTPRGWMGPLNLHLSTGEVVPHYEDRPLWVVWAHANPEAAEEDCPDCPGTVNVVYAVDAETRTVMLAWVLGFPDGQQPVEIPCEGESVDAANEAWQRIAADVGETIEPLLHPVALPENIDRVDTETMYAEPGWFVISYCGTGKDIRFGAPLHREIEPETHTEVRQVTVRGQPATMHIVRSVRGEEGVRLWWDEPGRWDPAREIDGSSAVRGAVPYVLWTVGLTPVETLEFANSLVELER